MPSSRKSPRSASAASCTSACSMTRQSPSSGISESGIGPSSAWSSPWRTAAATPPCRRRLRSLRPGAPARADEHPASRRWGVRWAPGLGGYDPPAVGGPCRPTVGRRRHIWVPGEPSDESPWGSDKRRLPCGCRSRRATCGSLRPSPPIAHRRTASASGSMRGGRRLHSGVRHRHRPPVGSGSDSNGLQTVKFVVKRRRPPRNFTAFRADCRE
jgi:hypothetical protein